MAPAADKSPDNSKLVPLSWGRLDMYVGWVIYPPLLSPEVFAQTPPNLTVKLFIRQGSENIHVLVFGGFLPMTSSKISVSEGEQ